MTPRQRHTCPRRSLENCSVVSNFVHRNHETSKLVSMTVICSREKDEGLLHVFPPKKISKLLLVPHSKFFISVVKKKHSWFTSATHGPIACEHQIISLHGHLIFTREEKKMKPPWKTISCKQYGGGITGPGLAKWENQMQPWQCPSSGAVGPARQGMAMQTMPITRPLIMGCSTWHSNDVVCAPESNHRCTS